MQVKTGVRKASCGGGANPLKRLSPWPRSDVLRWWFDDSGYIDQLYARKQLDFILSAGSGETFRRREPELFLLLT